MGSVKTTHRQSREMQQMRKHFRKHPEDVLIYMDEFRKCISDVIESLTPVLESLAKTVMTIVKEISQAIAERGTEVISPEDLSAFPFLEDLIKGIEENKNDMEKSI